MNDDLKKVLDSYQDEQEYQDIKITGVDTQSEFGNYPIHIAAANGDLHGIRVLLKNGADVNQVGDDEFTPLHDAVTNNQPAAIDLLLANGGDKDALNCDNESPWALAKFLDHKACYKKLKR
jgi:ankyrin repeat protein